MMFRRSIAGSIVDKLRSYAPDFCWCTAHDYLIMLEQLDEDVNPDSVTAVISRMVKSGELIMRPDPVIGLRKKGRKANLYLRVSGVKVRDAAEHLPAHLGQAVAEHSGETRTPLSIGR